MDRVEDGDWFKHKGEERGATRGLIDLTKGFVHANQKTHTIIADCSKIRSDLKSRTNMTRGTLRLRPTKLHYYTSSLSKFDFFDFDFFDLFISVKYDITHTHL